MKLVKMLQKARAAELGAFLAYDGHRKSLSDPKEREAIRKIQRDEIEHFKVVSKMLEYLGAKPDPIRDTVFTVIGNVLGFLCHYTGWFLPMWGAWFFEKIGTINYHEMSEASLYENHPELMLTLLYLMAKEEVHKRYFEEKIKNGRAQKESAVR
jgi:rubrerythrin